MDSKNPAGGEVSSRELDQFEILAEELNYLSSCLPAQEVDRIMCELAAAQEKLGKGELGLGMGAERVKIARDVNSDIIERFYIGLSHLAHRPAETLEELNYTITDLAKDNFVFTEGSESYHGFMKGDAHALRDSYGLVGITFKVSDNVMAVIKLGQAIPGESPLPKQSSIDLIIVDSTKTD